MVNASQLEIYRIGDLDGMNEDLVEHMAEMLAIGLRATARAEERLLEKNWIVAMTELDLAIDSFEQITGQIINAEATPAERKVMPME